MARQDEIYALARAALQQGTPEIVARIECLAANEPARSTLKHRLRRLLEQQPRHARALQSLDLDPRIASLVRQPRPSHRLDEVVLPQALREALQAVLAEQHNAGALREYRLRPRSRLLLIGPPGTGKTILAGALQRSFLCVEYGQLIASYLGGTGANITKLVDGLRGKPCVLLLDEMETVLSERAGFDGRQDVGEQARILSSLLMALDRLDDNVFVVGATNHAELLDRAVRRRFDLKLSLPLASPESVAALGSTLAARHPGLDMAQFIPDEYEGCSLSEVERIALSRARAWVIGQIEGDPPRESHTQSDTASLF